MPPVNSPRNSNRGNSTGPTKTASTMAVPTASTKQIFPDSLQKEMDTLEAQLRADHFRIVDPPVGIKPSMLNSIHSPKNQNGSSNGSPDITGLRFGSYSRPNSNDSSPAYTPRVPPSTPENKVEEIRMHFARVLPGFRAWLVGKGMVGDAKLLIGSAFTNGNGNVNGYAKAREIGLALGLDGVGEKEGERVKVMVVLEEIPEWTEKFMRDVRERFFGEDIYEEVLMEVGEE